MQHGTAKPVAQAGASRPGRTERRHHGRGTFQRFVEAFFHGEGEAGDVGQQLLDTPREVLSQCLEILDPFLDRRHDRIDDLDELLKNPGADMH